MSRRCLDVLVVLRAPTQECHAANTGYDTPPHYSIQTRGRLVDVVSIDVERHTGIMFWARPDREILPHTPANAQLFDAVMVVVSRKLGRKFRTNRVLNPGPVVCESITLSARPQLLLCLYVYVC